MKKFTFKKFYTISVIVMSVFAFLVMLIYPIAGQVAYKLAVASKVTKTTQRTTEQLMQEYELPENKTEWILTSGPQIWQVKTEDNLNLIGVMIPAETESDNWVITLHGYRANWAEMGAVAMEYRNRGFNVVMPDQRGHHLSEGSFLGLGYYDGKDILKWIDKILSVNPNAKIVLHGRSMGGTSVMFATGENLPDNVVCAISDCGYSNAGDVFKHVAKNVLHFPFSSFIISSADKVTKQHMGVSLSEIDTAAPLSRSKTPTLFIHGEADTFVPYWMLDVNYNRLAEGVYKEKLVVSGAEHAMSSTVNPELFNTTVFNFVNRFI